jgi:hypothetical protein
MRGATIVGASRRARPAKISPPYYIAIAAQCGETRWQQQDGKCQNEQ